MPGAAKRIAAYFSRPYAGKLTGAMVDSEPMGADGALDANGRVAAAP